MGPSASNFIKFKFQRTLKQGHFLHFKAHFKQPFRAIRPSVPVRQVISSLAFFPANRSGVYTASHKYRPVRIKSIPPGYSIDYIYERSKRAAPFTGNNYCCCCCWWSRWWWWRCRPGEKLNNSHPSSPPNSMTAERYDQVDEKLSSKVKLIL